MVEVNSCDGSIERKLSPGGSSCPETFFEAGTGVFPILRGTSRDVWTGALPTDLRGVLAALHDFGQVVVDDLLPVTFDHLIPGFQRVIRFECLGTVRCA